MNKFIFRTVAIQTAITLLYLGICSYWFATSMDGDPIQVGLVEWIFMIAQFSLTGFFGLISIAKATDKRIAKKKVLISLLIVIVILGISLLFDGVLWHWLWSFRKDVIQ